MRIWLFVLIAVFVIGSVFACAGCVSEEIRGGRGTARSYHKPGLTLESMQLRVGGRGDGGYSSDRDRK